LFFKGFDQCPINSHKYITDFECTGTEKRLIHESMLSFYSGHSAFSFYVACFTSLYLQARLYKPVFSRLFLPVVQFALFGCAAFVAYTRVSNYKHHWSDVLIGCFVGSIIGIIVAVFVAEVFNRREIPLCDENRRQEPFGLIPSTKAPTADVESGLHPIDDNGRPINAARTIMVTQEYSSNHPHQIDSQPLQSQNV
uniref:AcidPPc domain-containing protein n=1 Tax=Dracunculus medinensis TaxID=318479 RepID=A0A0N4UJA9_DRAME